MTETSSRPAQSEVSWDDIYQVFDNDRLIFRLFDAKNGKTPMAYLQLSNLCGRLKTSANHGIAFNFLQMCFEEQKPDINIALHYERLQLSSTAFIDGLGHLSVTFAKIKKTSSNKSAFITWYPCPPGWEKKADEIGLPYFFNVTSSQLTGVLPPELNLAVTRHSVAVPTDRDFDMNGLRLPEGWTRKNGPKGIVSYYNAITEATQQSTPLYQGEATSYSLTGYWDVGAAKPNKSDFQFFETVLESYNDYGRQENNADVGPVGPWWGDATSAAGALATAGALAPAGTLCIIQ